MTNWQQQQDIQTINKPTNFTNNKPKDIWLTKDGLKHTNHVLVFTVNNTMNNCEFVTNQDNAETKHLLVIHNSLDSDDDFCSGCRNVRQSMTPQTVFLRTTFIST